VTRYLVAEEMLEVVHVGGETLGEPART